MPTKNWDGQNANHRKKSAQNANLWLAFCLVGILPGWHFVLPPVGGGGAGNMLHDDFYTLVRWKRLDISQTVLLSWCCFTHKLLNWANSLVGKGFIFHGILTMIKHGDDTALDFTDDMIQLNLLFQGQWQNNSSKWEDLKIPLAKKSHSVCQIWLAPLFLVCSVVGLRFCWWSRNGLIVVWGSTNS